MLESFASALSAIKAASPKILLSAIVATGILLFAPPGFVASLGMVDLIAEYRKYIGLGFLVSCVLLVADVCWQVVKYARQKLRSWRLRIARLKWLIDLTPDEKAYLIPYIIEAETTQYLAVADGVVNGLISKGVLHRAASIGSMIDGFAVNMQPWARKHLSQNPGLLNGAGRRPPTPRERIGLTW